LGLLYLEGSLLMLLITFHVNNSEGCAGTSRRSRFAYLACDMLNILCISIITLLRLVQMAYIYLPTDEPIDLAYQRLRMLVLWITSIHQLVSPLT
jgi:hypothetical protein